jgi:biotin transport system permease protein
LIGLYQPGRSMLHRLPAGAKLLALALAAAILSATRDLGLLSASLAAAAAFILVGRLDLRVVGRQLAMPLGLIAVVAAGHAAFGDAGTGIVLVLRFGALLLFAVAVTATTRLGAMADAVLVPLRPLRRFGVRTERIGFAIMLALRLLPAVAEEAARIREAQKARGGRVAAVTLGMPLLVACLRMAERLAEAIDARGGVPDERPRRLDSGGGRA